MSEEDKIWSRYSNDKVDIGEALARVIRTLSKEFPLNGDWTALSLGSSNEPQFRILETAFRGGLYLVDIEEKALETVRERIKRQRTGHVKTICGDYNKLLRDRARAANFRARRMDGRKAHLITLHHSLYYAPETAWSGLFHALSAEVLAPRGAIHAVLMAPRTKETHTTSWLYERFAGTYCGCQNRQDLYAFGKKLAAGRCLPRARICLKKSRVAFFAADFERFMAGVWMILLYPNVHRYTLKQREEIAECMYTMFWKKKRPLIQVQDHLVMYRGIRFKGLL